MLFDPTRSVFAYCVTIVVFFVLFVLAYGFAVWRPQFRRVSRRLALLAILVVAGQGALFLPSVAQMLNYVLEVDQVISTDQLEQAQAIVIVGGGVEWVRAQYGAELQSRSGLPILVAGGNPSGAGSEAENMKKVIEQTYQGSVRWVESASINTADNARLAAKLLHHFSITRIALVTDPWHMPRATLLFKRQGLQVYQAPVVLPGDKPEGRSALLPSLSALKLSLRAVREWLGMF